MRKESRSHPEATPKGERLPAGLTGSGRPKRKTFPLSIRSSLVLLVLIPMVVALGLASRDVATQASRRSEGVTVRQQSRVLDSLLHARIDVNAEYVPSAAIVAGRENHLSVTQLDDLLGVNFQANLIKARNVVDHQSQLSAAGTFAPFRRGLLTMRRAIDDGTATPATVEDFFYGLGAAIDGAWMSTFDTMQSTRSSDSRTTLQRLTALESSFEAFTSGLGEESLQRNGSLETILVVGSTPAALESLIISHQKFQASTRDFPDELGPKGAAAWSTLINNPLSDKFKDYVDLGITIGLNNDGPPFATSAPDVAEIGKSEVEWANSLTNLVLSSSADLRAATDNQADSATATLELSILLMALLVLLSVGGALAFGRAVRRPIAEIGGAFDSLRHGELELPQLDESGPRELARMAVAFNEMTSTLRGVQAQAIALSNGDLDDPALLTPLPGRMGDALQTALNRLQISIRASEAQRQELFERATRDALTGLLNRGAALEALNIHLAGARRSQGGLVLTVLFIDLDELKQINDSMGHEGGDDAIRAVADALRATTRAADVVSRYGGDEFVVGWLGKPDPIATALLAKRISELVASSVVRTHDRRTTLGCSIGVAVSGPLDSTVLTLIERADHALYEAKKYGRGQVRWFETV